ncbi:MAG: multiheme c-type cytochrome, partial [Phycisphaeraceae bacterium]
GDTLLGGSSDEADEDEGDSLLAGDSSDDAEDSDDALLLGGSDDTDDTDDAGDSLLGGSEDADDADDAGDSLLGGSEDTDDTDDAGDSLLAGNGDEEDAAADDDDSLLLGGESADETSTDDEEPIPSAEPLPMAKMAAGRGWRIDDQAYAIRYQPAGHADAFLEQWLRAVAHQSDRPASTATRQVFDALTDANAVGRCIKCHSVDRTDERMFEVNWQAQPRDGVAKGFHRFAHQPHLIQPQLADCRHCHQEAADADVLAAFDGFDVRPFRGEFQPIQRNTCASCHTPDRAGDSCLDCHNYHTAHEVP